VRARHEPSAYADQVARLLRGLVADPDALPADLLAPADAVEGRRGAHSAR
jgi:hypothetical protein